MSEVDARKLDQVVGELNLTYDRTTNPSPAIVAEAIGKTRPLANPNQSGSPTNKLNELNAKQVEHLQRLHRFYQFERGEQGGQSVFPRSLLIPEAIREIDVVLEIDWLLALSIIVSGEYKEPVKRILVRKIAEFYAESLFPDDGESYISTDHNAIQVGYDKFSSESDYAKKRILLIEYWLTSSDQLCADFREYLSSQVPHLHKHTYLGAVSDYILERLKIHQSKKTESGHVLFRQHPTLPLTVGLEIEIPRHTNFFPLQTMGIDGLLKLGMPVTYEFLDEFPPGHIREVPLPYSEGVRDQLVAIMALYQSGILKPEYKLNLHINVGELGQIIDEDIYYLYEAILMADLFGKSSRSAVVLKQRSDPRMTFHEAHQKPMIGHDSDSPYGLPFIQRDDGSTLEIRGGISIHGDIPAVKDRSATPSNLEQCVRDSAKLAAMSYALLGHRKLVTDPDNQQYQELSQAWIRFRSNLRAIHRYYSDRAITFHDLYQAEGGNQMENLELRYSRLLAELVLLSDKKTKKGKDWGLQRATKGALNRLSLDVRKALMAGNTRLRSAMETGLTV